MSTDKTTKRRDDLIDITVGTDYEGSHVDGRNGMFHIQKLYIWESVDHEHVYLEGIGKRGVSIRGGFLVTKECFEEVSRQYLNAARGYVIGEMTPITPEDCELCQELAPLNQRCHHHGAPTGCPLCGYSGPLLHAPDSTACKKLQQQRAKMKKFKMVCSECGSEEVLKDAYAIWSVEEQEWILRSVHDHTDCEKCGAECKVKEIPADDCQIDTQGFCTTHQKVHLRETAAAMEVPAGDSVTKAWSMFCPKCCSDEGIEIQASVWVKLTADGGTDLFDVRDGSHEWNSETLAQCRRCDFSGTVGDFELDEPVTDEERSNGPRRGK